MGEHQWFREAMSLGKQPQAWYMIKPGSQAQLDWQAYWDRLGWEPSSWKMFRTRAGCKDGWMAPCERPEWIEHKIKWRPVR